MSNNQPISPNRESSHSPTIRVSLIVINKDDEILLVKHRKKDREYWVLPGGHLEYGETFAECAIRELKEETNLDGHFQKVVFFSESIAPNNSRHIVNIFVLVDIIGGSIKMGDEDVLCEVSYKRITEINQLTIYPNINEKIILNHKDGWKNEFVELLNTPWN